MAQLLVRNLDEDLVLRLQERAELHRRSVEAEHRAILEEALRPSGTDFWSIAHRLQQATGQRPHTDAALLIRADRDREHPAEDSR